MCGTLSGTHTCLTVLTWLIGQRKLSQVTSNHVKLDLHIVEGLSIVDCDVVSNHFRKNDSIAKMSLDGSRLLSKSSVLLSLLALSVQPDVSVFNF